MAAKDYIREFKFDWKPEVHPALLHGAVFDRYDDDSTCLDVNAFVQIDENGFFLYWKSEEGKEPCILDLVQVWEARRGGSPKDGRVQFELEQRGPKETLEDRTVWITHGEDLVNISSVSFVARDLATLWRDGINEVLKTSKVKHSSYSTRLLKTWYQLTLQLNEKGKIPIKNIIKLFSCGKDDTMTLKCLGDFGLYGDKVTVLTVVMYSYNYFFIQILLKEREDIDVSNFPFERFLRLYQKIAPRSDIQELFVKISGKKEYVTRDRLMKFMNETQRDARLNELLHPLYTEVRVQKLIIDKFETDEKYVREGKLSGEGFLRFMMADENSPVYVDRINIYQDMDEPLCNYYINSSHNTYLTGRQYGAKSSIEIYRQVLLSGCRCVELDCWDGTGENKGEPIITHGKAMCTDVFFRDVLYQIRETAFARSDYPVILSLENHCSKANQLKMAKYIMEIFGDMLLTKPLEKHPLEPGIPLPSPNSLQRKILIKNKRLKPEIEKTQLEQFYREGKIDEEEEAVETPEVTLDEGSVAANFDDQRAHPEIELRHGSQVLLSTKSGMCDQPVKETDEAHPEFKQNFISKLKPLGFSKKPFLTAEEENRIYEQYRYTGATTNVHPLLSSLVVYTCPVKFQGFAASEERNIHYQMSSFSESMGLTIMKQNAAEFVSYNERQMSRIYPKGARVDSSNFLPQVFWNVGCQMVALNFQTADTYMQLNHGKFEWNGGSGYLLKPEFMRRVDKVFNPFAASPVDGVVAAQCSVKIISGHFLCPRRVGTYVEVEMYGLPSDTIRKEHRTRTVPANALNPFYDSEPFVFRKVVLPELAVLRFAVYDETGKQIGQRILPFDGLQPGYRHITLRNESNISLGLSTLFVYICVKTYVPDGLNNFCDALAEPRKAYEVTQDKLENALHNMGVDESDYYDAYGAKEGLLRINGSSNNAVEDIKIEDLKKDKSYVKLAKKMEKEMIELKKKQEKQRLGIQKNQQVKVEKLISGSRKRLKKKDGSRKVLTATASDPVSSLTLACDNKMRSLVSNQTKEWSMMMNRHVEEVHNLRKTHIRCEFELLMKLLNEAQKAQLLSLQSRLAAESKLLQSLLNLHLISFFYLSASTLKTKTEKDRRWKEKSDEIMKLFLEQRRRMRMK
uniref:1-phosphatidylinositol 4,5-bisphosphate phosphodiesterase n=1 Tax=Syphacia muris TaxID=451379 RepID=A0A158R5J0_9BILA